MNKLEILLLFCIYQCFEVHAQLVVNEFMQSNVDCIMDDLNEFPDSWVELYNTGKESINLTDYKLSTKEGWESGWSLPDSVILPSSFVVIFCDKVAKGLHTDFQLDSGKGGAIFLYKGKELVDKIDNISKQPAPNISYGRKMDGIDEWGYQFTPTPNMPNCGTICSSKKILPPPIFNKKGFVTTSDTPFELHISLPEEAPEGTKIFYTLNGCEPTREDFIYVSPILITSTTIVRAKLYCEGYLSPISSTQSYIFFPREQTLPIVSLVTNNDYINDPTIGIFYNNNVEGVRNDWRRPLNFEYFEVGGSCSILNQLCEFRVMGGSYTRAYSKKSMTIYANKRFGKKRLSYEFFPEDKPGLTDFKSILLRNGGNDFKNLNMRDAIIQKSMSNCVDLDWQAYSPAIVYVNGNYYGLLNIRERSNEDYVYTNYQGIGDIDMVENWHDIKAGDNNTFELFKEYYSEPIEDIEDIKEWIDLDEYINLMLMHLYFDNKDFPANNFVMWRPKEDKGKWRFIAKDTDFGLGLYGSPPDFNTLKWITNPLSDSNYRANTEEATLLFRNLLKNMDFVEKFINTSIAYIGDFLKKDNVKSVYMPMRDKVIYEYPYYQLLFNPIPSTTYDERFEYIENWLDQRPFYFLNHMSEQFHLGKVIPLKIDLHEVGEVSEILLNGIKLNTNNFSGGCFMGRNVSLGVINSTNNIYGWRVKFLNVGEETSIRDYGHTLSMTIPDCLSIEITPIITDTSITENESTPWSYGLKKDHIVLSNLNNDDSVFLYNASGVMLYKTKVSNKQLNIPYKLKSKQLYILKVRNKSKKIFIN